MSGFEPDFLYPLENVTVAQGRDATFTCVVNNLGGYRVSGDLTTARVCINHCKTYIKKTIKMHRCLDRKLTIIRIRIFFYNYLNNVVNLLVIFCTQSTIFSTSAQQARDKCSTNETALFCTKGTNYIYGFLNSI